MRASNYFSWLHDPKTKFQFQLKSMTIAKTSWRLQWSWRLPKRHDDYNDHDDYQNVMMITMNMTITMIMTIAKTSWWLLKRHDDYHDHDDCQNVMVIWFSFQLQDKDGFSLSRNENLFSFFERFFLCLLLKLFMLGKAILLTVGMTMSSMWMSSVSSVWVSVRFHEGRDRRRRVGRVRPVRRIIVTVSSCR
jgi:hypothetical protein